MTCIVIPADSHPYVCRSHVTPDVISDLVQGMGGGFAVPRADLMFFMRENQEDPENQSNTLASVFASVLTGGKCHLAGTVVVAGNAQSAAARVLAMVAGTAIPECLSGEEATMILDTLTEVRLALHGDNNPAWSDDTMTQEEFREKVRGVADKVLAAPRADLTPYIAVPVGPGGESLN